MSNEYEALAYQGESKWKPIEISISDLVAKRPGGLAVVMVNRPGDRDAYIPEIFEQTDESVIWTPTDFDTCKHGTIDVQGVYTVDGDVIGKTDVHHYVIKHSLRAGSETPPDLSDWVNELVEAAGNVHQEIADAEETLDTAVQAAQDAKAAAETAQRKAETAKSTATMSANAAYNSAGAANTAKRDAVNAKDDAVQAKEDAVQAKEDAEEAQSAAEDAKDSANESALKAEGYAVGTQDGVPAGDGEPYFHDNAKYYKESAEAAKDDAVAAKERAEQVVSGIEAAGNTQVEIVNAAGDTQTQAVNTEGSTQVSAVQAKGTEVLNSIPADYTELSGDVDDLKINKADVIISSASGSIASFPDGADAPIKSLSVAIEPVQDLHGYDSPWPAGGGKNKIASTVTKDMTIASTQTIVVSLTKNVAEITIDRDLTISLVYRFNDGSIETVLPAGNYFFSTNITNQQAGSGFFIFDATTATILGRARAEGGASFSLSAETTVRLGFSLSSGTKAGTYWFQIESGSTATSFAPYENLCPISGRDAVKVTRTGKNLFDTSIFTENGGVLQENGMYYFSNVTPLLNKVFYKNAGYTGQLVVTLERKTDVNRQSLRAFIFYTDGTSERVGASAATGGVDTYTVVTASGKVVDRITGDYGDNVATYARLQIELGSTATAYEPYQGQTYDIAFPSEAGTVYGGELTVNEDGMGTLVVDRAMYLADGSVTVNSVSHHSSGLYYTVVASNIGAKQTNPLPISNRFKSISGVAIGNCYVISLGNLIIAVLPDQSITTKADATKWFADNPTQFVYELATPITYTLTASEIRTLLGTNNVWADAGDVGVEYRADTKLYIDNKITQAIAAALNA